MRARVWVSRAGAFCCSHSLLVALTLPPCRCGVAAAWSCQSLPIHVKKCGGLRSEEEEEAEQSSAAPKAPTFTVQSLKSQCIRVVMRNVESVAVAEKFLPRANRSTRLLAALPPSILCECLTQQAISNGEMRRHVHRLRGVAQQLEAVQAERDAMARALRNTRTTVTRLERELANWREREAKVSRLLLDAKLRESAAATEAHARPRSTGQARKNSRVLVRSSSVSSVPSASGPGGVRPHTAGAHGGTRIPAPAGVRHQTAHVKFNLL